MPKNENYNGAQSPPQPSQQEVPISQPSSSIYVQGQMFPPQFQPAMNMTTVQQQQQQYLPQPYSPYVQYSQQQHQQPPQQQHHHHQLQVSQPPLSLPGQQTPLQQRYMPTLQHPHSPSLPHHQLSSYQSSVQSQLPLNNVEHQQQHQQQPSISADPSQEEFTATRNASTTSLNTESTSHQLQPVFNSTMHNNEASDQADQSSSGPLSMQSQYSMLGTNQDVSSSSVPTSITPMDKDKPPADYGTTTTDPSASSSIANLGSSSATALHRQPPSNIEGNIYLHSQSSASLNQDEAHQSSQIPSHPLQVQPPGQSSVLHSQSSPLLSQLPQYSRHQSHHQPINTHPHFPHQSATLPFAPSNLSTLPPHPMDVSEYPDMTTFVNSNINSIPIPLVEARFVDHRTCEICGKRITRDMSRHMRTHQSESRFTCEFPKQQCRHKSGKFNRPYDYKKHLLNRHYHFDDPEVKKLHNLSDKLTHWGTCPCGLRFTGETWLEEHILTSDLSKRCPILDPK